MLERHGHQGWWPLIQILRCVCARHKTPVDSGGKGIDQAEAAKLPDASRPPWAEPKLGRMDRPAGYLRLKTAPKAFGVSGRRI